MKVFPYDHDDKLLCFTWNQLLSQFKELRLISASSEGYLLKIDEFFYNCRVFSLYSLKGRISSKSTKEWNSGI